MSDLYLELFVKRVIREMWECGDLDGGWIQDTAVEYGVLVPVEVVEPCGEVCACNEFDVDFGDGRICYRFADEIAREAEPAAAR